MTNVLLEAALETAAHGWPVFPLVPRGRVPALHGLEDCPGTGACANGHLGWEQRGTLHREQIRTCWMHDAYNIGVATGPAGLCVIDLDVPKPGKPVPNKWVEQGCREGMDVFLLVCADAEQEPPLETRTVRTHSGGYHLYFTLPITAGLRITEGERNGLGWGIDTRAGGGYVIAPGSIRSGGRYEVIHDAPVAPLPDWLIERLTPRPLPPQHEITVSPAAGKRSRFLQTAIDGEVERVQNATGGERNFTLYCAANALGQLVAGGALTEEEVTAALLDAAQAHVAAGAYRWNQARQTIRSGLRAGADRPRKVAA